MPKKVPPTPSSLLSSPPFLELCLLGDLDGWWRATRLAMNWIRVLEAQIRQPPSRIQCRRGLRMRMRWQRTRTRRAERRSLSTLPYEGIEGLLASDFGVQVRAKVAPMAGASSRSSGSAASKPWLADCLAEAVAGRLPGRPLACRSGGQLVARAWLARVSPRWPYLVRLAGALAGRDVVGWGQPVAARSGLGS